MNNLPFPKKLKLRRAQDFDRVYRHRQRAGDQHLLVFAARNSLGWTRIGLSVSRKQGNSVRRSRIKRLLREAFRLQQHDLPQGLDLILIPRPQSGAQLEDYQSAIKRLSWKLFQRLPAAETQ